MKLDSYCRMKIENPNMLVPWWIMAAYAYEQGWDFISDGLFDHIAERLRKEWDSVEHRHKQLLARRDLKTSLAINGKWPAMAKGAAFSLMQKTDVQIRALVKGF